MLKNKLPIVVAVLFLLVGCSSSSKEKERILIKNNQGIFFNVDNELYPVYSLETLNSSEGIVNDIETYFFSVLFK